jgi:hypothetical protein
MAKGLFDKAKKAAPAKAPAKKDDKVRLKIENQDFFNKIARLEILQDNMKRDKADADMIADEIKEIGKVEWSKLYAKTGKNPGSVMLEDRLKLDIGQVMFVPTDGYIKIGEDRATQLVETFGEDIVEEKTTFAFDNEMVDKYGEIISQLIESSTDISDDDKERIIKATTTFNIKKGSIDKLKELSNDADMDIADILEEVKPIIAIKNVEVIKG